MPTLSEALTVAVEHHQAGRLDAAEPIYRQILAVAPNHSEAWHLLGVLAHQTGRHAVAVEYIERAMALGGPQANACSNLSEAYRACKRFPEAAAACRQALALKPGFAAALNGLGLALQSLGQHAEAFDCFQQALQSEPDYPEALNNLGNALADRGKQAEAMACYRRAIALRPRSIDAYNNLGNALQRQCRFDEAVAVYRHAIEIDPRRADLHNNLGALLKAQGRLDEALAAFRQAVELTPDYAHAHSNLLYTQQYREGVTLAELAAAHAEYQRRDAAPLRATWQPHANSRDPRRKLRLGFVSPDFGRHPVGFFLIRTFENLDRRQCDVVGYCDALGRDDLTARFEAAATLWRPVAGWTDQRLAEQIRADAVDILFDLTGHSGNNRLLVFARKPAPIQITWMGYEGTTGLAAIDYILADGRMIPPEAEPYYCEKVLRLPDSYICYDPPAEAPPVAPLPALAQGHVTLGCFNNPSKLGPAVAAVWAEILRRLPQARLLLKCPGLNDPLVARALADWLDAQQIERGRVTFAPPSPYREYLAAYHEVDLMLDSFPFSGGVTTCEALWMGVPVLTFPGATFAGRHPYSYLSSVGLTETIARDRDDYVDRCVALAADLPRLSAIRTGLRPQMAASPLCDGPRFTAHLLQALRDAWRGWCESATPV